MDPITWLSDHILLSSIFVLALLGILFLKEVFLKPAAPDPKKEKAKQTLWSLGTFLLQDRELISRAEETFLPTSYFQKVAENRRLRHEAQLTEEAAQRGLSVQ